jgi:hypothetical protein
VKKTPASTISALVRMIVPDWIARHKKVRVDPVCRKLNQAVKEQRK